MDSGFPVEGATKAMSAFWFFSPVVSNLNGAASTKYKDFQKSEALLLYPNDVLNREKEMKLNENRFPKPL